MVKLLANFKSVNLACFMNSLPTMRKSRTAEFMIYIYELHLQSFPKLDITGTRETFTKCLSSAKISLDVFRVSTEPRLFSHLSCPFGQSLALRRKTLCFGPSKGFCLACEAFLTSFCNHSTRKPKLVFFRR